MALGGPNKHTLQVFRASKAKTPVTYSKNGLCTPLKPQKAHCKGVWGVCICFCFFSVLFFAFPFFFYRGSRSGKPGPGPGLFQCTCFELGVWLERLWSGWAKEVLCQMTLCFGLVVRVERFGLGPIGMMCAWGHTCLIRDGYSGCVLGSVFL